MIHCLGGCALRFCIKSKLVKDENCTFKDVSLVEMKWDKISFSLHVDIE